MEEKNGAKEIIDHHIHIGQFYEEYYEPLEIMRIIEASGLVAGCCFSSTTTGVKYAKIEREIQSVSAVYPADIMQPYFRFMPAFIKEGISIESAMKSLPYRGFKIHPMDEWNFENDSLQTHHLHQIFDDAGRRCLPVLIHTGESGIDSPDRFEMFFREYQNTRIILAHCRPAGETIKMFRQYKNVYGDTAFAPKERINEIVNAGYADRLIFGTDFPVTHYFARKYFNSHLSLSVQYEKDINGIV